VTTCYLDPEDEITGAVGRIRAVEDGQAILVLPPGSRIATSRINFRLLAREAEQLGLTLVAVSDEPGVRALAISAGVPAYDSVGAAQAGLAEFERQDRRLAERISRPVVPVDDAPPAAAGGDGLPSATDRPPSGTDRPPTEASLRPSRPEGAPPDATRVLSLPPAIESRHRRAEPTPLAVDDDYDAPVGRARRRRRGWALSPLIVVALLIALVCVAAYGAYNLIPTATITLRPHLTAVGPVNGVVVADPQVAVVDANAGVIPAQRVQLPLSASGLFEATGTRVTTVRATGTVRFRSENTVDQVPIPAGTRVLTANNVAFETTAAVTVPIADFGSGTPGLVDAPIRAVRAGPRGNVGAEAIRILPEALAARRISVSNPQPTSGGERRETRVVSAEDYQQALAELRLQLDASLGEAIGDPQSTPRGLTLYPESAQIAEPVAQPTAGEVVDSAADEFSLTLTATASLLAVNETLVEEVMLEQLRALVPATSILVDQSVEASHTPGEVSGQTIVYSASANGRAYRMPEREPLVAEIRGLPVADARAIIARYGNAELSVWPDFVDRVPDQPARINLTILPPTEGP
jgi:hypothetical protein